MLERAFGSIALPVTNVLEQIVLASRAGPLVLTAPPGSGKTTLVPPAILDDLSDGRSVVLLQPRRMAARSVARWIAAQRQVKLGQEVGYQVRFDRCASKSTRLLVMTTGVLLRRFVEDLDYQPDAQARVPDYQPDGRARDPLLDGIGAVVLDEFHERTLEMDLALGMLWRIKETLRPDLRLLVMSATLDAGPVSKRLGGCPVIEASGRVFPVEIRYAKRRDEGRLHERVLATLASLPTDVKSNGLGSRGHILVFLPGVGEIRATEEACRVWAARQGMEICTLFGDMPAEAQDEVLRPTAKRRLILSTNVAETSLTIEGVTVVIDSGFQRQQRYSSEVGLSKLELIPISQGSAEQRAGRAGRMAPGICYRLWERAAHASRIVNDPPEVLRSDFASAALHLLLWGERDIEDFPWLTPPSKETIQSAMKLLLALEAIDEAHNVTPQGRSIASLPTHPRLARLIIAGAELGVLREASLAAALLSERDPFREVGRGSLPERSSISDSDVVDQVFALQRFHAAGGEKEIANAGAARVILITAEQFFQMAQGHREVRAEVPSDALRQALLSAFPDRLSKLRTASQDRGLMVGGRGVRLVAPSRVRGKALFLAIDADNAGGEARVRKASMVEREWLKGPNLRVADESFFHPSRLQVEARRRTYWHDLLLEETPIEITDLHAAAELLAAHARANLDRVLPAADHPSQRFRLRVNWLAVIAPDLGITHLDNEFVKKHLSEICRGLRSFEQLRTANWLDFFRALVGFERIGEIDRLAPPNFQVPSGSRIPLAYSLEGPPTLSVRIQEMFGLAETPRIVDGRIPLLLELLGPNYRPQQLTSDLASFWKNTYPTVMKELRRRYPKHPWPDCPAESIAKRK